MKHGDLSQIILEAFSSQIGDYHGRDWVLKQVGNIAETAAVMLGGPKQEERKI